MTERRLSVAVDEKVSHAAKLYNSDHLIITTHPTQADIDRAEDEHKMVLAFVKYPERVAALVYDAAISTAMKSLAIEAWSDGIMQGWGVLPSLYMMLFVVGRDLDTEEAISAYKAEWNRRQAPGTLGATPQVSHLGTTNMITKSTLKAWGAEASSGKDSK